MKNVHADKLSFKLKEIFPSWEEGSSVLIASGTGTGKTYFVFNELLKNAVANNKYLVYICNRNALKNQISENYSKCIEDSGHKAIVVTYQFCEKKNMFPDFKILPNTFEKTKDKENDKEDIDNTNETISSFEKEVYRINNLSKELNIRQEDVMYYIFDEAHYFVSDALFNSDTNYWFEKNLEFKNSISVFITATPEPLYCFLQLKYHSCFDEIFKEINKTFLKRKEINKKISKVKNRKSIYIKYEKNYKTSVDTTYDKEESEKNNEIERLNKELAEIPPFEYLINLVDKALNKSPEDFNFSYVYDYIRPENSNYNLYNVFYFENYDDLLSEISNSDNKWLIFVDKEEDGKYIQNYINIVLKNYKAFQKREERLTDNLAKSAVFISSKTIKKADPYVKKTVKFLNSGNSIAPKVLIATSVIDCGVSINIEKCPELTNIVIAQPEKTEFLQMLGRIRLNKNSNQINLFIKYSPVGKINSLNNSLGVKIEFLKNFYLLNRTIFYPQGTPTETYDGMGEKNLLTEKKVEKTIKEFLKTDRGNLLVRRKKEIAEDKRVDGKQFLYEYDISKTAVIHLAYVLWQYNQVMKNDKETDLLSHLK